MGEPAVAPAVPAVALPAPCEAFGFLFDRKSSWEPEESSEGAYERVVVNRMGGRLACYSYSYMHT